MSVIKPSIFKPTKDPSLKDSLALKINLSNDSNEGQKDFSINPFSLFASTDQQNAQKETSGSSGITNNVTESTTNQAWSFAISESQEKIASYRNSGGENNLIPNDLSGSNSLTGPGSIANIPNSPNFIQDGITGENQGFSGIPNDGQSDPLYDASKHTLEENQKISNMMTIVNSSSSSEVSNANSLTGEYFTHEFSKGILEGKSLQDVIKGLDGANLRGAQTSVAYNTENMSKDEISSSNKANGTAIILRGSNDGVGEMMAKDEANLKQAYSALGLDVKVVHSEKEFEQALLAARDKAITDKAEGKESILATHVISHGLQAGGTKGADANSALAMKGGGLYHEKDIIGDIAGALEPGKEGESPFKHSYNAFTACHSGGFDNEQTLLAESKPKEEQPTN